MNNNNNENKKPKKRKHLIECYDDIYIPIIFILTLAFILGLIGSKYNEGYSIPLNYKYINLNEFNENV